MTEMQHNLVNALHSMRNYISVCKNCDADTPKVLEIVFKEILEIIHDYKSLIRLEEEKPNCPAVDLYDKNTRTHYQITTSNSPSEKCKNTVDKIQKIENEYPYDKLVILFLTVGCAEKGAKNAKKKYEEQKIKVTFIDDFEKEISPIATYKKDKIIEILNKHFPSSEQRISKEIEIIRKILKYVQNNIASSEEFLGNMTNGVINPEKKLNDYFKDNKDLIERQYNILRPQYQSTLQIAVDNELDSEDRKDLKYWLQTKSLDYLIKNNKDGFNAIDNFQSDLERSAQIEKDTIIKFFLLEYLFNCSIFPIS